MKLIGAITSPYVRKVRIVMAEKKLDYQLLHESELDVVAFNPETKHLVHIEPSMDCFTWEKREKRYKQKFAAGKKDIFRNCSKG